MKKQLIVSGVFLLLISGCGANGGTRPPTARELPGIVAEAKREMASVGAADSRIHDIRVSRRDPHYAYAEADPGGAQLADIAEVVLVEAGGRWNTLVIGDDLSTDCRKPAPQPVRDLLRCR
jgi:hypothetical protein